MLSIDPEKPEWYWLGQANSRKTRRIFLNSLL